MNKLNKINEESDLYLLLSCSRGANSRKKVLKTLLSGPNNCNQIAVKLGLNWRTTYRHLQILKKMNLVKSFGFGQRKFYKLTQKGEEVIIQSNIKKLSKI